MIAPLFLFFGATIAANIADPILDLGLGDLMKVKVTSVERRESDLSRTAAAVYVLTAEDISHSGATSIPDLLRRVPGLHVAQSSGNTWAISARGFNGGLANKLLVLIDGRSVYTPLYGGVFWDVQDMPLETIERIEVIRGPGGTLWGSNAVNGVINIIRKSAKEQSGTMASVAGGDEERLLLKASQGWNMGGADAVAYGKYRETDGLRLAGGGDADDDYHLGTGGVRVDGTAGPATDWTVSADAYGGQFDENRTILSPFAPLTQRKRVLTDVNGGNVLARVSRRLAVGAVTVQTFFDRTERRIPETFHETRNTADVEVSHALPVADRHTLTWGAGFRSTSDRIGNSFSAAWDRTEATDSLASVYAQDEVRLSPRLWLTLGSKLEHNDYTGWEFQPSGRLGLRLNEEHLVWASVSRAVRTPTRYDQGVRLNAVALPGPAFLSIYGDDDFVAEKLVAYEAGYRASPSKRLFVDVAGFFNKYDDLATFEQGTPIAMTDPAPHTVVPFYLSNRGRGESFGGEIAPRVELFPWWSVEAQYSYLHLRLHAESDSQDFVIADNERNDPMHQFTFISDWALPHGFSIDGAVRWVDELRNLNVDDYTAIDLRLAWKATDALTAEVIGRNLFETSHREFSSNEEVEPAVFGKLTWRRP